MAWIMNQKLDVYAVVASANRDRMKSNIRAAGIGLSDEECRWLNLETDER